MKYFFVFLFCWISAFCFSQASILWEKEIGGGEDDWGYSICFSHDDRYVFTGVTSSYDEEVTDSIGGTDLWLGKMNTDSTMVWSHTYGGTDDDRGNSICLMPDNGFALTGFTLSNDVNISENKGNKDLWVIRTDASGNLLWSKTFGGASDDVGNSVIPRPDGGVMVAGSTFSSNGDVDFNHGAADFWVLALDANGNLLWEKTYAGSGEDRANEIVATQDGNYAILGTTFSSDGDVSVNLGGVDFWLIKIDDNGNLLWEKSLGGSSADQGFDLIETSSGNLVVVGEVLSNDGDVEGNHGIVDAWMAQISSNGELIWQNSLGGSHVDYFLGVTEADDMGLIAVGNTFSDDGDINENFGESDVWMVKVSPEGELIWQKSIGYDLNEIGNDVITSGEKIVIWGGIQVDHLRHGNSDAYIVELRSPLTIATQNLNASDIQLYPNPSSDFIQLDHDEIILKYQLIHTNGEILQEKNTFSSQLKIPIKNLPSGIYHLRFETKSGTWLYSRVSVF